MNRPRALLTVVALSLLVFGSFTARGIEPPEGVQPPDAILLDPSRSFVRSFSADSAIAAMIASVDADSIVTFLERLSGEVPIELESGTYTLTTRYTEADEVELAAEYLAGIFRDHRYQVEMHYFNFPYTLRAIVHRPGQEGLIVGARGRVLRTGDGETWTRVKAGLESIGTVLYDLDHVAGARYLLVGGAGTIASSDDAGESWMLVTSSATRRLNSVDVLPSGTGWIVGRDGAILSTTDSGDSWSDQTSGTTSFLYDVVALDDLTAVAVGADGLILKTFDGGASWLPRVSGTSVALSRLDFAGTNGWAVGAAGTILATTDAGETWSGQTSGVSSHLNGVSFADADHGWAVGGFGTILRTENGGVLWSAQASPVSGITFQGVSSVSTDDGWIVGLGGQLLRTDDGGATWESRYETIRAGWANVVATRPGTTLPEEEVLLVGHYDSYASPEPDALAPGADDNGSGISVIVETARLMAHVPFERTIRFVCFSGEEIGLLGSAAYAARAAERGEQIVATFNLDSVGWNDTYFRIFSNDDSGWLGNLAESMAYTFTPWLTTYHWYCPGCTWSDHGSFWAHGFPAIVGIETWDPPPPQHHTTADTLGLMDIALVTDVTKIALGTIATVASVDTTAATAAPHGEHASSFGARLESARPNPFDDVTAIRFHVPASGEVELTVVTVGGRTVRTLQRGRLLRGAYTIEWDGRDHAGNQVASGVYFYRLEVDTFAQTRRVVLLR